MMRISLLLVIVVGGVGGVACAGLPASPSFQSDVAPIFAASCVRCHGDPAIGGAPPTFRLDGYPDCETPANKIVLGAGSYAFTVVTRVVDKTMPPRFPLDDDQIEILMRWADEANGAVRPPRGAPRPGNRAPALVLSPAGAARWDYELHDPDGDLVVGTLRARLAPSDPGIVVASLHSGRGSVVWNTAGVAPGTYAIVAQLDDGGAAFTVDAATVVVP